jgi:mRNA-degrading endonuclease RelE of RelBE toxin-antitoxin system
VNHFATPRFWYHYRSLPPEVRKIADKNFELLKDDPRYPSLHLKQIGKLWSVRVGKQYRALGLDKKDAIVWFWIGTHADYDKLIK